MIIELKLFASKKETPQGFPLAFEISHKNVRRQISIGFCFPDHFLKSEKNISRNHPDFNILFPIINEYKEKARKIVLLKIQDVNEAKKMMLKNERISEDFFAFSDELFSDMKLVAQTFSKRGDFQKANKILKNIDIYENAITQFKVTSPHIYFSDINYNQIMRFRRYQEGLGNSKSTIHHYLRTLRAIYNKGLLRHEIPDSKPFNKTFDGLKIKSYESKKKSISKESILTLESADLSLAPGQSRSRDLWLLQFYFGGADLIDIYYLETKHIRKNRIFFTRTKTSSGLPIDLSIHPKAKKIINRYREVDGNHLFPWRKDKDGYETFRGNISRDLIIIQRKLDIEILPIGGNLGIKVARHTFGNIAKKKKINEDVIRELMGHERDEVDNFYKDRFDEEIRDLALFEIISSFDCTDQNFPFENK